MYLFYMVTWYGANDKPSQAQLAAALPVPGHGSGHGCHGCHGSGGPGGFMVDSWRAKTSVESFGATMWFTLWLWLTVGPWYRWPIEIDGLPFLKTGGSFHGKPRHVPDWSGACTALAGESGLQQWLLWHVAGRCGRGKVYRFLCGDAFVTVINHQKGHSVKRRAVRKWGMR